MGRPGRAGRGRPEARALSALLLALSLEIVAQGAPRVRVETDGSPPARHAAGILRRHVVLLTGVALPEEGGAGALRFELSEGPGYEIVVEGAGAVVRGSDPVRAAYDLLEGWGCRFGGGRPEVPRAQTLTLAPRRAAQERTLFVEAETFDASLSAHGVAVRGLAGYDPARLAAVKEHGYELRVASETFDDFLPPALFAAHPEYFALRRGEREPRGNFALLEPAARAAYLDRLGAWLEAHPEVDCVGIWPEVTTVWDEAALARGPEESYALLWREAAARFPGRRFEILATGLTLRPPEGPVPGNVEVRLRPGPDASGLQGIRGQEIEAVVDGWEARGARVVLEIDAAPEPFCGMPWPCEDAIRENAGRFRAAVLRGGGHRHARHWRDPSAPPPEGPLRERAARVRSWGHPGDAADLFFEEESGLAFRIGAVERLLRVAQQDGDPAGRRSAAADAFLGFQAVLRDLPPAPRAQLRRWRARDYRRVLEELLPEGVEHEVGPAKVREGFDRVELETDQLRLAIDRKTASVVALRRRQGKEWSPDLAGGGGALFTVVSLRERTERTGGDVHVSSPETGRIRIELEGVLRAGGPAWRSRLELGGSSGLVRQTAEVDAEGGLGAGCRWSGKVFDRWVCPPHALEGEVEGARLGLHLPRGTLFYCRDGERGAGLALRVPDGGLVSLAAAGEGTTAFVASHPARRSLTVDWIVFTEPGELGK